MCIFVQFARVKHVQIILLKVKLARSNFKKKQTILAQRFLAEDFLGDLLEGEVCFRVYFGCPANHAFDFL